MDFHKITFYSITYFVRSWSRLLSIKVLDGPSVSSMTVVLTFHIFIENLVNIVWLLVSKTSKYILFLLSFIFLVTDAIFIGPVINTVGYFSVWGLQCIYSRRKCLFLITHTIISINLGPNSSSVGHSIIFVPISTFLFHTLQVNYLDFIKARFVALRNAT